MKKILTLIICAGAFISAFSQTNDEEARRVILGGKNKGSTTETSRDRQDPRDVVLGGRNRRVYDEQGNRYPSGTREQAIDQVNREYDQKVSSIRNNPNLSNAEKERIIRELNNERARKIKAVNNSYKNRDRDRDRDDDDDDDDYDKKDKKYKKNNGNHYGWEKGKGNPHRTGSDNGYNKSKGNGKSKGKKG